MADDKIEYPNVTDGGDNWHVAYNADVEIVIPKTNASTKKQALKLAEPHYKKFKQRQAKGK